MEAERKDESMTEIKTYRCAFCGREYLTYGSAESCEDSHENHEKDVEISSVVYDSRDCKGMPCEIRLANKKHTKLATYKIADVTER